MFFKKKQKLLYPKVVYANREYYEVPLTAVKKLEKVRVKVSGKIKSKPEIKYYSAGFPWSLEARNSVVYAEVVETNDVVYVRE